MFKTLFFFFHAQCPNFTFYITPELTQSSFAEVYLLPVDAEVAQTWIVLILPP